MSESPETPKILDQIAKGTGAKSGSRSQQNARRRFYILLFLFIPVLAGLGYMGYFQLNVQQRLLELESQNAVLASQVNSYEQEVSTLRTALDQLPTEIQVDEAATEELSGRLDAELEAVRAQLQTFSLEQRQAAEPQAADWKILEAEYLLELAARKLQFEEDINAASLLLEQADSALRESGNSGVFAARQAISSDLGVLRSIEPIDREGIYIRVQNLIDQVTDIPLQGSMRDEFQNRQGGRESLQAVPESEAGMVDQTLEFLGTVFVWRRWEETPEAMVTPGQDLLIRQRLRLSLEQLQLALTRGDGMLYRRGMTESLALFERHSVVEEPASQAVLTELRNLQEIDINPALPSLTASRESVSQLAAGLR